MRAPRTLLAAVVLGAFTFAAHEVHGQAPSAKSAYEAATAAFTAKRYAEAATGFARADLLEPNAIAAAAKRRNPKLNPRAARIPRKIR